jgi:nitroreductase
MDVLEAIRTKRAVRQFSDKPVPKDQILAVLDTGRRSQSSKNTQPWEFIVVQDKATLQALSKTAQYAGHLAGASFAVVFVGTGESDWNSFDLGQTAAYMQLGA